MGGIHRKVICCPLSCSVVLESQEGKDKVAYVVAECDKHQDSKYAQTYHLHPLHHLLGRLAASDGLYHQEEDVPTIKSGDWQEVHDGQDDADECSGKPELLPVPCAGEDTAYGDE